MDRQDRDIDSGWVRIRPQGGGRPPRVEYIPPGELGSYLARERTAAPRPLWPAWLHAGRIVALAIVATGAAIVCSGCEPEQLSCAAEEPDEPATDSPVDLDPQLLCARPGDVVITAVGTVWRLHVCFEDRAPAMDLRAEPETSRLTVRNSVQCEPGDPAGDVAHNEITIGLDTGPIAAVLYSGCTFDARTDFPPPWGDQ